MLIKVICQKTSVKGELELLFPGSQLPQLSDQVFYEKDLPFLYLYQEL